MRRVTIGRAVDPAEQVGSMPGRPDLTVGVNGQQPDGELVDRCLVETFLPRAQHRTLVVEPVAPTTSTAEDGLLAATSDLGAPRAVWSQASSSASTSGR